MAFQMHDLCGFLRNACSPVLASFVDSKLLDIARASDSIT